MKEKTGARLYTYAKEDTDDQSVIPIQDHRNRRQARDYDSLRIQRTMYLNQI